MESKLHSGSIGSKRTDENSVRALRFSMKFLVITARNREKGNGYILLSQCNANMKVIWIAEGEEGERHSTPSEANRDSH